MQRRTLDEFKKLNPHLDAFWPYLELLNKESDRGAVLISTGFLEQQLRDVLLAFMLDDKKVAKLVDGANAPLGTFSSRIAACYAFGLISEKERFDLDQLRGIRNDFAHNIHVSFETQSVINRCATLRHKAHDYDSEKLGEVRMSPSAQFRTAAVALIMSLINRATYASRKRRITEIWPDQSKAER